MEPTVAPLPKKYFSKIVLLTIGILILVVAFVFYQKFYSSKKATINQPLVSFLGTIAKIDGDNLTLDTKTTKAQQYSFKISQNTHVNIPPMTPPFKMETINVKDLKPGYSVIVSAAPNSKEAKGIAVVTSTIGGIVSGVSGNTISVKIPLPMEVKPGTQADLTPKYREVKVVVDKDAQIIKLPNQKVSISDTKVDQRVVVFTYSDTGKDTISANIIEISVPLASPLPEKPLSLTK